MRWLDVDKEGLRKLLLRRGGMSFVFFELLSNGWDTDAKTVRLKAHPIPGRPFVELEVEDDDPNGFSDLSHSFTLFAASSRRGDPERRGRFNLGEKLVLACCERAEIQSTKGTVIFDATGRHTSRACTEKGTIFRGTVRMTREEYAEAMHRLRAVIPPPQTQTFVNDEPLPIPEKAGEFKAALPTEIADEEGVLRRSYRYTISELYVPRSGDKPWLYEMGIPVVELLGGEPWSVNVLQKIPLNAERDGVPAAFLRDVREGMLNGMHDKIVGHAAASALWVRDAAGSSCATKPAVAQVLRQRFGEKVVSQDPSDREAEKVATANGYIVIPGGAMSAEEWENVKKNELILPAGRVFPTRPEGAQARWLTSDQMTAGMHAVRELTEALGIALLGRKVSALFFDQTTANNEAQFGNDTVSFNVQTLGHEWFEIGVTESQVDLILHELGHGIGGADHLSKEYNNALTHLGAKLAFYITRHPDFFASRYWRPETDMSALIVEVELVDPAIPF